MRAAGIGQLSSHFHISVQNAENPKILNVNQAFQVILKDFQDGRIKYISEYCVSLILAKPI